MLVTGSHSCVPVSQQLPPHANWLLLQHFWLLVLQKSEPVQQALPQALPVQLWGAGGVCTAQRVSAKGGAPASASQQLCRLQHFSNTLLPAMTRTLAAEAPPTDCPHPSRPTARSTRSCSTPPPHHWLLTQVALPPAQHTPPPAQHTPARPLTIGCLRRWRQGRTPPCHRASSPSRRTGPAGTGCRRCSTRCRTWRRARSCVTRERWCLWQQALSKGSQCPHLGGGRAAAHGGVETGDVWQAALNKH